MNKLNLVPAIKAIQEQIEEITDEYTKKLAPYNESLEQLRAINTACERCCGKGKILRSRVCAEDDRPDPDNPNDWIQCPDCYGTGRSKKEEKT